MALSKEYSGYKIDGVTVPDPQTGGSPIFQGNRVSISWNNANGDFIDKGIALKKKFQWNYNDLSKEEVDSIFKLIYDKWVSNNSFQVTSWVPGYGMVTETCYCGTPTNVTSLGNGHYKAEIHWIQIKGKKSI